MRLLVLPSLLLLASCTSNPWRVESLSLTGESFTPKPDDFPIEVFHYSGDPTRSCVRLAVLQTMPKSDFTMSSEWESMEVCLEALKQAARALGADAIIEVNMQVGAPGTVGMHSWAGTCVAVRWTD